MGALVGFLVDVLKVLGLVGFSLTSTLLAHTVVYGLVSFADSLRKYLVGHKVSQVCEYGWQSLTGSEKLGGHAGCSKRPSSKAAAPRLTLVSRFTLLGATRERRWRPFSGSC